MQVRIHVRNAFLIVSLLVSSCTLNLGGSSADQPTPTSTTSPQPTVAPTPEPTPTPQPQLLLFSAEEAANVQRALEDWAQERGWLLASLPVDQRSGWQDQPGMQAVVILESVAAAQIVAEAPSDLPVVVVGEAGVTAEAQVSTVGPSGARHDQAAFLAGVMAGLTSENWVIALIEQTGGDYEDVYRAAFLHGVRYTCPYCWIVYYTPGGLTSEDLQSRRVDVVFSIPGLAVGRGSAQLSEADVWVVWAGSAPEGVPPERLAGGVVFAPEVVVPLALEALLGGEPGMAWPYSANNGGLRLAGLNPEAISPGRQRLVESAWEELASGELEVGVDPVTGEER